MIRNFEHTFKIHRQQIPCYQDHHQPLTYFCRITNKAVILATFPQVKVHTCLPYNKLYQRHSFMSNSFSSTATFYRWLDTDLFAPTHCYSLGLFHHSCLWLHRVRWGNRTMLVTWLQERERRERGGKLFLVLKLGYHTAAQTAVPAQLRDCMGTEISVCAKELAKLALTAIEMCIKLWLQAKWFDLDAWFQRIWQHFLDFWVS